MDKYCMSCGGKIEEGEKFCQNCGASTEELNQNTVANNNVQPNMNMNTGNTNYTGAASGKTNGLAIGSFVCSLVGLLIFGLIMGILAISLGATAKKRMQVFPEEKGKGLATAGIVIGIIDVAFTLLWTIIKVAALV